MSRGNNSKYVIFFKIWIHIGYLSTFKELLWILYGPILCIIVDWLYFVKFWKKYAKITIWYNLKIDAKILLKLTNFMSYRCFQSTLQYILFVFFVQIIYRNDKNRQFFFISYCSLRKLPVQSVHTQIVSPWHKKCDPK